MWSVKLVPYRYVVTTELNHLPSLAKWLSVRLRTNPAWHLFDQSQQ